MRFRTKFIIFIVVAFILCLGAVKGLEFAKERYIYKSVGKKITSYINKECNANISIGKIKGNIWTNLVLKDVSLYDIKGYPEKLRFNVDAINLSYRPLGILSGNFNAKFENCQITYGDISLPVDIYHREKTTTIFLPEDKLLKLDYANEVLPKNIRVSGNAYINGEVILKDFKFHLFDISIKSQDCQIIYEAFINMKGKIDLGLYGRRDSQNISGYIDVHHLYLSEMLPGPPLFKTQKAAFETTLPAKFTMDIDIRGDNISIRNNYISGFVNVALKLKRDGGEDPHLLGGIDLMKGRYRTLDNEFRLSKGQITFTGRNKSPFVEIEGETKIRRYKIFAKVNGTLDESHLVLSSRPELSYHEIASLLIFGRKTDELIGLRQEKFTTANLNNIILNNLFFGKAEAILAKSAGLDDVNVQFDASKDSSQDIGSPSIEVGKYVVDDKVYLTYRAKPDESGRAISEQSIGSELELTENIKLSGRRTWEDSLKAPKEDRIDITFRWKF